MNKILMCSIILPGCTACIAIREKKLDREFLSRHDNINFEGNQSSERTALVKLGRAFREAGIDLAGYVKDNKIYIKEEKDYYAVSVSIYSPQYDVYSIWEFEIPGNLDEGFYIDIRFTGNQKSKKGVIELLDTVLKTQGDLGAYGNLTGGIKELKKYMNITIKDEETYYSISMAPKSNSGHDFYFTIDKKTGNRSDVMVGEVVPPPGIDE